MNERVAKKLGKEALALSTVLDQAMLNSCSNLAKQETSTEAAKREGLKEFIPKDRSGKNYDKAYAMGVQDGAITVARRILGTVDDEVSKVS